MPRLVLWCVLNATGVSCGDSVSSTRGYGGDTGLSIRGHAGQSTTIPGSTLPTAGASGSAVAMETLGSAPSQSGGEPRPAASAGFSASIVTGGASHATFETAWTAGMGGNAAGPAASATLNELSGDAGANQRPAFGGTTSVSLGVPAFAGAGAQVGGSQPNASTGAPPEWTCDQSRYGAGDGCTCGCGVLDPDCDDAKSSSCSPSPPAPGSCARKSPWRMDALDPNDNSRCVTAPFYWTCAPSRYGTGQGCDCGCGELDPDCASRFGDDCANYGAEGSCSYPLVFPELRINVTLNYYCIVTIPTGWTCDPDRFRANDGDCDCGCGVIDPDCPTVRAESCNVVPTLGSCVDVRPVGDLSTIDEEFNANCTGWTCAKEWYGDGLCHCGCGIPDPDCIGSNRALCDYCGGNGSCADHCGQIQENDNTRCKRWTCSPWLYARGDGICDCGCGITDPDCTGSDRTHCDSCAVQGSCTSSCDQINPTDNAVCEGP
ncbi:MAG TPA: hypothetical protein VKP30_30440 [Polyangiaceae bacterium]|nr:hypothetical protein [Polyangiaceae bacterium]